MQLSLLVERQCGEKKRVGHRCRQGRIAREVESRSQVCDDGRSERDGSTTSWLRCQQGGEQRDRDAVVRRRGLERTGRKMPTSEQGMLGQACREIEKVERVKV